MQAIEFETLIDKNGHIQIPKEYQHFYGKSARFIVLLPENQKSSRKRRQPGSAKGVLQVLSDDGEHLDNFREL